jgi:hypothetical protein
MTFRQGLFRVFATLSIINPIIFCIYIVGKVQFNGHDSKEWALLFLYMGLVCGITWGIYWGFKYGIDAFIGIITERKKVK